MKVEEELRLSFYKEIASVNERHGVKLVQHVDTGKVYVKSPDMSLSGGFCAITR